MAKAELKAVISADARAFYKTLGGLRGAVIAGAAGVAAVGGAIGAAWVAAVKGIVEYGSAVNDLSERTGLGTSLLQELGYAASMVGADMADIEPAVKTLANALQQAGTRGGSSARKAFRDLGLSWQTLAASSPDQQLTAVLDAIGRIQDPTKRAAAAVDLLGKSGIKLVPVATSFRQLSAEARAMGLVIPEDQIRAADDLGDAVAKIQARVKGLAFGTVAPSLKAFADSLNAIAKDPKLWAALQPALATINDAMTSLALKVADMAKNPEVLAQVATAANQMADSFKNAADAAGELLKVIGPALQFINESVAGLKMIPSLAVTPGALAASGPLGTGVALASNPGVRGAVLSAMDFQAQNVMPVDIATAMLAALNKLVWAVTPLTQEQ